MIAFSPKSSSKYNSRSISFPARSHPSTQRVEEELNKLKASQETSSSKAETICFGLSGLKELYSCIEELLNLPSTRQALAAQDQNEKLVNELLDSSLRYLDVCSKIRDDVLAMKESVRELQSALRRRKVGDSNIESDVASYFSFRKKMKKEIGQSLTSLKQIESKYGTFPLDLDTHLSAVVRVLRESSFISGTIFRSFFLFLSTPLLKPKQSKWSLVSMMVHKGIVCEEQKSMNELESVDVALSNLSLQNSSEDGQDEKFESAQKKLEALDFGIEGLENGLESLFRLLIHNRVALLNILSH
ncbi:hypothetical protein FEM48_Zijuj08G0080500 [Ziziphus jujuba var. spinosa]|uniref:Uncharacterized protein n=1 Tax=Ziziphus jujuba var. spinosa TaxID=714518 RepID=A0A978UXX9_ZIZJJ|nr:hypothetical protein FEM48_Zijuj08G0080500 [Ziziphus jujuba var. spinosa]